MLQTQRQLQVSLEAHGRYISRLIEPATVDEFALHNQAQQSLKDVQPALQLTARPTAEASLDVSHSSASHVQLVSKHSAVYSVPVSQLTVTVNFAFWA